MARYRLFYTTTDSWENWGVRKMSGALEPPFETINAAGQQVDYNGNRTGSVRPNWGFWFAQDRREDSYDELIKTKGKTVSKKGDIFW